MQLDVDQLHDQSSYAIAKLFWEMLPQSKTFPMITEENGSIWKKLPFLVSLCLY